MHTAGELGPEMSWRDVVAGGLSHVGWMRLH